MADDNNYAGYISSTPEINTKLSAELSHADIQHRIDDGGGIWFDSKYQNLVSAMSKELVKDIFRPYKELVPGAPREGMTRPLTDLEGALFISGIETKFGNFANSVTLELANNKKIEEGDYEVISRLLSELTAKFEQWRLSR